MALLELLRLQSLVGSCGGRFALKHSFAAFGSVVFDYADGYGIAIAEMAEYLRDGKMKSKKDVVVGLDAFPESLLKLFNGENFGKLVLQVAGE